jgi:hypothetical protein
LLLDSEHHRVDDVHVLVVYSFVHDELKVVPEYQTDVSSAATPTVFSASAGL